MVTEEDITADKTMPQYPTEEEIMSMEQKFKPEIIKMV